MITVSWHSFWSDEKDKLQSCKEFMPLVISGPNAIKEIKEDPEDDESNIELIFHYYDETLNSHDAWNEIADFARQNELYVIVYDHDVFDRMGYWYDEQDEWIEQNFGENEHFESLVD